MSPSRPSEDAIRRRAHEIWQRRGSKSGSAADDWMQAERELGAESARAAASLPTAVPSALPSTPKSPAMSLPAAAVRLPVPAPKTAEVRPAPKSPAAVPAPAAPAKPRGGRNGHDGVKARKKR